MIRPRKTSRLIAPALMALVFMLFASAAHADYEQVPEHFGVTGEGNIFLNAEVRGLAINETGVGGVPAGSIYAATRGLAGPISVVRLSPGAEGEDPQFEEAWGWEIGAADGSGFQRCGPALVTEPANHTFHTCREKEFGSQAGQLHHFGQLSGIAVDQENGFVYVRNNASGQRTTHLVEVFTATGTPVGEGFGDLASAQESIADSPQKLHMRSTVEAEAMTLGEDGTVYLTDADEENPAIFRVMSFAPAGGNDFSQYVYTGAANDLRMPFSEYPNRLAWAGHGHLITAKPEQLHEYSLSPFSSKAVCNLAVNGTLKALTANPLTGEVFYFNQSKSTLVRLSPCNEESHKFTQLQQLKVAPTTENLFAMAVNPGRQWSSDRPEGVLYLPSQIENPGYEFIGDVFAPSPVLSPLVEAESVTNTGVTSTTLKAQINPRGLPTHVQFQYLPASTYEAQLAAAKGEGKVGAEAEEAAFSGAGTAPTVAAVVQGNGARTVIASVAGLTPDTPYRFRAIASSECVGPGEPLCESAGVAALFSTYPTPLGGLPDGRAYELVSPAEKNGGEVFAAEPGIGSCGTFSCKPPGTFVNKINPMQSAPDGNAVAYMGYPFSTTEGAVLNSYISRRTAAGWQTVGETPASEPTKGGGVFAYDQSLDAGVMFGVPEQQFFLRSATPPFAQTGLMPAPRYREPENLKVEYGGYSPDFSAQFFSANDSLTSATADAPEPPDPGIGGTALYEWRNGQLSLVNVLPGNAGVATGATFATKSPDLHAVSADGSRVFWRAGTTLYVRENGETTREIAHPGSFVAASEDGETVLLSDGCLYALSTEACVDLTQGEAGFKGLSAANGDFSRVYFVDSAKLPGSGANERGAEAVVGKANLYLYEAGASTRFIGTLAATDGQGTPFLNDWGAGGLGEQRTAEASPDGRYLTFGSIEPLTGADNVGPCAVATIENESVFVSGPCPEVFLYDSVTGRLACPSCNPTGEAPLGRSTLRRIAVAKQTFPQPRYLANNGRLFFDSGDRLSARDTNGNVEDVYEYEPEGVGGCGRTGGCISLISSGSGSVDSNFLAADASGANVFFTSREQLVQKDTDDLLDLYDAREGGGFASDSETQRGECQGESCQPTVTPPNDPTPGSSSFNGPGNVKEAAKPKKKKHNKHSKKHKRKTGHQKKHSKHGRAANNNRGGAK